MAGRKHNALYISAAVLLCFAMLAPFSFIIVNSGHDCTHGDDCLVCRMINVCIHSACFELACIAIAAFTVLPALYALMRTPYTRYMRCPETLFLMKTELRN